MTASPDPNFIIIAIDGPSASGKSTVSRLVADALGYLHVDTGSMYRAFTWKVLQERVDPRNASAVLDLMRRVKYECDFVDDPNGPSHLCNRFEGTDPGPAIRGSTVESVVSLIAAMPEVRAWLVQKQRALTRFGNLVVEGRDIGTIVFPDTPYKFYLDADPEVRARRRAVDLANLSPQKVGQAMGERDRQDSTRAVAPLKIAKDAMRIDTSAPDAQVVADLILKHIRSWHLARRK